MKAKESMTLSFYLVAVFHQQCFRVDTSRWNSDKEVCMMKMEALYDAAK